MFFCPRCCTVAVTPHAAKLISRQGDSPLQQPPLHRGRGLVRRGGWSLGTVFREIPRGNGRRVRPRLPRNICPSIYLALLRVFR